MCVFKHLDLWRPNGRSDRDGGGTVRCAGTPERRWCRSRVDPCHVARATCQKVKQLPIFLGSAAGHTTGAKKARRLAQMHATAVHYPFGVLASRGASCTPQGCKRLFRWGPLVSGNFEVEPRNLAHRCNSMSAIERCITWGVQLHGARAERVQAVWTFICKEVPNFEEVEVSIAKFGT